jgi:hypothetical protein
MWIVPSEFSKALEGLSRLGGEDGESRSWLDVDPAAQGRNGAAAPAVSLDTSGWFDSNLPPAAEQPEAKIGLSSIGVQPSLPTTGLPTPPSLAQATEDVQSGYAPSDEPPEPRQ